MKWQNWDDVLNDYSEYLHDITIEFNGEVYAGYIHRVGQKFPTVYIEELNLSFQFSRDAILRGLNGSLLKT